MSRDRHAADQLRMTLRRMPSHLPAVSGLADHVGDVEGEEVARSEEALDSVEVDVVGIEEVGLRPAEFLHRRVGRLAGLRWARSR